jgi:hypothetical protein
MRNGSACSEPPTKVAKPVMKPRPTALPRPVSRPSSERASERPIEIAAPRAAARPTKSAAWEPERNAAAKIGASVETVPSIRPMSPGWMTFSWSERSSRARIRSYVEAGEVTNQG